jgi:adenylate cyclase
MPEPSARSRLTLRFLDGELERRFQLDAGAALAPHFRLALTNGAVLWIIAAFLLPVYARVSPVQSTVFAVGMVIANLVSLVLSHRMSTLDGKQALGSAVNVLAGLAVLWLAADAGLIERYATPGLMLIGIYAFVLLRLRFVAAGATALVFLAGFVAVALAEPQPITLVVDGFLLASGLCSAVAATYLLEGTERDLFRQRELIAEQEAALRVEKAKSDRLLRSILPETIIQELREGARTVAQKFDSATIVFADLVGFTPLAERMAPEETAAMLNELYSEFDEASRRHGVEKIKTIGDSYMAASGVPDVAENHAGRAVAFAMELLAIVRGRAEQGRFDVAVRIGIHSGPVVAGVIGKTKFSYDLWGDTVNVASRLESVGLPGAIQVSGATRALLGDRFRVESRGTLELKGHGPIPAYLIVDPSVPAKRNAT